MRLPMLVLHVSRIIVGSQGHRIAENIFVVAMLVMGACALCLA